MIYSICFDQLIVLGFNDTSNLASHFVSSPREREKRYRRDSRRDEREGQEETGTGVKVKKENIPPLPLPATRIAGLVQP